MINCLLVSVAEIIISACAVAAAVASSIIALIFGLSQRKFNINSVRPIPQLMITDFDEEICIKIANLGTGPLIIKKLRFKKYGIESDNLIGLLSDVRKDIDNYNSKIINKPNSILQNWESYINDSLDGEAIGIKDAESLIRIKPINFQICDKLRASLAEITVFLEYQDIYGNNFNYQSTGFKSFVRKDDFLN